MKNGQEFEGSTAKGGFRVDKDGITIVMQADAWLKVVGEREDFIRENGIGRRFRPRSFSNGNENEGRVIKIGE